MLLVVVMAVCILAIPASAGAVTVTPVPSLDTVEVNQTFDVDVNISGNSANVTAMDFRLDFDKTKLQVVDYHAGNFMQENLVPVLSGPDEATCINQANNDGIIGAGLKGANNAESGKVMTITFKAIAAGQVELDVVSSSIQVNGQNSVSAALTTSAEVVINEGQPSVYGDFTGDGKVNYPDLLIFVQGWNHKTGDPGWDQADPSIPGSPFSKCDIGPATGTYPEIVIARDGIVNYPDLLVFVNAWNWSIAN